jgi:diguanylate cyclase (GGDEF)-like protein/PAS domain S-box-containing protein
MREHTPSPSDPKAPGGWDGDEALHRSPARSGDALARLAEAEDMIRAIGAGEVDAFVLPDGHAGRRVFTLETADRPYRMFVENMRDGAATVSSTGLILFANRRLGELLSCSRESIVGAPLTQFLAGDPSPVLHAVYGPEGHGVTVEADLLDADGRPIPVLIGSSPLAIDGRSFTCITFFDLRDQKAQEREIARLDEAQAERLTELESAKDALALQATHDGLTGLPNRALLVDRINQALAAARRSGRCTAVYFLDMDGFKDINDTQGHAAGDAALQRAAQQLVATVRPMDSVARMGGDEFAVLAVDVDSHEHAVDIGARLVDAMSAVPRGHPNGEHLGASVGLSISDRGRGTAEILIHEADTAMYKAKADGGGRAEVFDAALDLQSQHRANAKVALQCALDERRIVAHYQPIVNIATGQTTGFEVLARITENSGTLMSPKDFIPTAEESGLIVPLGAEVLTAACKELGYQRSSPTHAGPWNLAVNVSARQFESGELPAIVRRNLEEFGLDPTRLHLELTETAIMALHTGVLKQLAEIRDLGVEVGLDDFGTGYASLTHLRRLPVSFVKIDQTFVQGITTDSEDEGIVSAVIALSARLGLRSIAEGVETVEQLDRLREFGCDEAQGYLFAKPQATIDAAMGRTTASSTSLGFRQARLTIPASFPGL